MVGCLEGKGVNLELEKRDRVTKRGKNRGELEVKLEMLLGWLQMHIQQITWKKKY